MAGLVTVFIWFNRGAWAFDSLLAGDVNFRYYEYTK